MTSQESTDTPESTPFTHNLHEYSVSELAGAVKRTMESSFSHVRVRGEISGFKRAASGHLYLDLKDNQAVLNAVCWKGVSSRFSFTPEDGMEVICTGRISTYPGRSNYQLVIEQMEIAGIGALMALLEKRKSALTAEGLFDASRKQPLPFLPKVIGVVTSPTGAVIRDILHRLSDRFPLHVLVWPVLVQGKGAEIQIAQAIEGFNRFDGISTPPRPDVLIVARGGGSIEDLWCFNEEIVVRAAAASTIPLISAVGHETDTTLIDFAASRRAPTPTAAAEMAVPVLADLRMGLLDIHQRLDRHMLKKLEYSSRQVEGLARGLLSPEKSLEMRMQRLDEWTERLESSISKRINNLSEHLTFLDSRLSPVPFRQKLLRWQEQLVQSQQRMQLSWNRRIERAGHILHNAERMLEALGHHNILKRGFAYVTGETGEVITSAAQISHEPVTVHFSENSVVMIKAGAAGTNRLAKPATSKMKTAKLEDKQESLF